MLVLFTRGPRQMLELGREPRPKPFSLDHASLFCRPCFLMGPAYQVFLVSPRVLRFRRSLSRASKQLSICPAGSCPPIFCATVVRNRRRRGPSQRVRQCPLIHASHRARLPFYLDLDTHSGALLYFLLPVNLHFLTF